MDRYSAMTINFHDKMQRLLARKARHECMYPGCKNSAIHAHAISKEHALRGVAENGQLVHPVPIRDDDGIFKEIRFKEVGMQGATTFKGFCIEHDALFSSLDKQGVITQGDVFRQLYRSFSSIVFSDNVYRASAIHAGDFENFNEAFELTKSISAERALALSYDLIDGYNSADDALPEEKRVKLTPFSRTAGMDAQILFRRINVPYPVALQKRFSFRDENNHFFDMFVFVIPSESSTTLLILCRPDYSEQLLGKIQTPISTLNFIESCMICDGHWWLSPRVVRKWSTQKQQLIEDDYWNFHELAFGNDYDISIFDEIRERLCRDLPSEQKANELAKIDNLPVRKSRELRRLEFALKVEKNKRMVQAHNQKNE